MGEIFKAGQIVFVLFENSKRGFIAAVEHDECLETHTVKLSGYKGVIPVRFLRSIEGDPTVIEMNAPWDKNLVEVEKTCTHCDGSGEEQGFGDHCWRSCRMCGGRGFIRKIELIKVKV